MADSRRLLVWLAYTVAVAVILSAILQVIFVTGALVPWPNPPHTTIVDSALAFRQFDQQVFPLVLVNDLVGLIAFVFIALLGVALRPFASGGALRDVLVTVLVIAGIVGIVAQLLDLGVAHAATRNYCDCGFKNEEVIAQDYALDIGRNIQFWLVNASFALVGIGTAFAGRLVAVSATWRWLSYLIAVLILFTAGVRLLVQFVDLNFDLGMATDILGAIATGILVPIWAVLLARGIGRPATAEA